MSALLPVLALLVIATVSLIVVRIGAIALKMTGLSWESAHFQANSAFFGVGFTTREAEAVVTHAARRKIVLHLIFAGNIGLTSALGALVVAFVKVDDISDSLVDLALILVGLMILFVATRLRPVTRVLDRIIRSTLTKSGVVEAQDYALLLKVEAGYAVSEIEIGPKHWLGGMTVADTKQCGDEILVLGILREDDSYVGAPAGGTRIFAGDMLTVYGYEKHVRRLTEARVRKIKPVETDHTG